MRFKIHRARLRWLATLATGLFLGVATATLHSQSAEGPVSPPSITSGELRSVKTSNLGDLDSFVLGPLGSAPAFSPMFNTSITHPDFSESWGYVDDQGNGIPGPNDWENIIPSSVTGNFQSPIDIPVGTPVVDLSGLLNLHYGDSVPHELFNNGHTIELEFEEGANHVSLGGQDFALLQFHFHTPSEHLVNGKQFPMAMHLVHLHENGGLTVIGVLFEEGTVDNPNFAAVFDRISEGRLDNKGDHVEGAEIGIVNPLMLLPSGPLSGYSYVGSLTTPPATEQVNWFVLSQPVRLSKNQIDAYRAAADDVNPANDFNPGARPTQSLAGPDSVLGRT
jgi:carbonic anhydrase